MSATPPPRWVLLIHQIPPKPDYLRVKVARRLQRLGAVAIKNSVYVLPVAASTIEDFQWLRREITADGGEASVCAATFVDGLADSDVEELFRSTRSAEYDDIAAEAAETLQAATAKRGLDSEGRTRLRSQMIRLERRLADATAVDFFGSPSRTGAEEAVGMLEVRYRKAAAQEAPAPSRSPSRRGPVDPATVRRRTWVTRENVFVDRIASAWLIRRFIDPEARFAFVSTDSYMPSAGELRFDMFEAEFTHEGDQCTFETLLAQFNLHADPALREVSEIVHDIDLKDAKFARPEAAGVERLLSGFVASETADVGRLERGGLVFEALYTGFRASTKHRRRTRAELATKVTAGGRRRRQR